MTSCDKYPIPFVLKKILTDRFDGELLIKYGHHSKNLFFNDGDLIFAQSDVFDERIGVLLYLLGKINDQQYDYISGLAHSVDTEVGKILVQNRFITGDDLYYATLFQMRKIAINTFSIEQGKWEARKKKIDIPVAQEHRVALTPIITEGSRKIGNISFYKKRVEFRSPRTTQIPGPIRQLLSPDEIKIFDAIRSCAGMSNHEIIAKMNLDPQFYWRKLILFILLDLIDFERHRSGHDMSMDVRNLIILFNRLQAGKVSGAELLDDLGWSNRSELKKAYLKLFKSYHPDRFGSGQSPVLKNIAQSVLDEIQSAYETAREKLREEEMQPAAQEERHSASDSEIDLEPYLQEEIEPQTQDEDGVEMVEMDDIHPMIDEEPLPESHELQVELESSPAPPESGSKASNFSVHAGDQVPEDVLILEMEMDEPASAPVSDHGKKGVLSKEPPIRRPAVKKRRDGVIRSPARITSVIEEAEELYKNQRYAQAAGLLKGALRSEPDNGDYHCLLGLCQTHLEFFQAEAERHLRKAIELNPWSSDPVYALGVLFRIQGKNKQAALCFERVMSMTANHHRAVEAMRGIVHKKKEKGSMFSFLKKDIKFK